MKISKIIFSLIIGFFLITGVKAQTVQQKNEKLITENQRTVFSQNQIDNAKNQGVPANIDTQVRKFIIDKFGGIGIDYYGDRIEKKLFQVYVLGTNYYGSKYNNYLYYTYRFASSVTKTYPNGEYKSNTGYDFQLDVIMKPNGEINEYKWTEKRKSN